MIKVLLVSSLMTIGLGEFKYRQAQAQAQVIWKPTDTPAEQPSPVIWETTISGSENPDTAPVKWEIIPKNKDQNQLPSRVIWEILETKDKTLIPPSQKELNSNLIPPRNLEEAEALLDIIPLQSSDFKPLLNLSHTVPTASVLSKEEWRLIASTISPFQYTSGIGNQNHAIQLDYGISDTFQV